MIMTNHDPAAEMFVVWCVVLSTVQIHNRNLLNMSCTSLDPGLACWRELELELIQTQMAQKPMLRAEVYANAMRASQNRKKEVRREKEV